MKAALLVLGFLYFAGEGSAQIIVTRDTGVPTRNIFVISYDDAFCWVGRHHGDQRDFGGCTEPGVFIHSKQHDKWLQIVKVATREGVFGTSNSDQKEDQKKLMRIPVGWDFTGLATNVYAEMPLRTSGSLAFPDRVEFDEKRERYTLGFMTACGVPSAATFLSFDRRDLETAFAHYRKPEPDGPANGSQPMRSEIDQTSAAAGSRR